MTGPRGLPGPAGVGGAGAEGGGRQVATGDRCGRLASVSLRATEGKPGRPAARDMATHPPRAWSPTGAEGQAARLSRNGARVAHLVVGEPARHGRIAVRVPGALGPPVGGAAVVAAGTE